MSERKDKEARRNPMNEFSVDIDYKLLDRIMENPKIEKMNAWEAVKHVYGATYMYFKLAVNEEKNLREKYEKKIVEKVGELTQIENELKAYKEKYGDLGEQVSAENKEEVEEATNVLPLHKGSEIDKGSTGPSGVY